MTAAIGKGSRVYIKGHKSDLPVYRVFWGRTGTVIDEFPAGTTVFDTITQKTVRTAVPSFEVDTALGFLWSADSLIPLDGGENLDKVTEKEKEHVIS